MGGYGFYIWLAYGLVFACLGWQWRSSWKKWQSYLSNNIKYNE